MNKTSIMVLGLVLIGLLLAGCTQPPATQNPTDTPPTDTPPVDTTPPTDTPPTDTTPPAETGSFLELYGHFSQLNAKVDYQVSVDPQPSGAQLNAYTYYLFNGKIRVDVDVTTEQGNFQSRMYAESGFGQDAQVTTCTNANDWMCFQLSYDPEQLAEQGQTPSPLEADYSNNSEYTTTADGTVTYAGETGSCFRIVKNGETGDYYTRYCLTSDGIPLYINAVTAEATFEMQAQTIARNSVTDADFVYPAEPQDFSSMMGGAGGTGGNSSDYCANVPDSMKEQLGC